MTEESKAMVHRMVGGINAGEIEGTVDELFVPRAARRVKRLFKEFHTAFPDWHEEIVELVAEGETVAADGKFVDFWALEDSLNRMRQLGLMSSPKWSE